MRTLTLVAVLALPITVVFVSVPSTKIQSEHKLTSQSKSVCGSNFIAFHSDSGVIVVSKHIWISFIISIGLTAGILILWWLWDPQKRKLSFTKLVRSCEGRRAVTGLAV